MKKITMKKYFIIHGAFANDYDLVWTTDAGYYPDAEDYKRKFNTAEFLAEYPNAERITRKQAIAYARAERARRRENDFSADMRRGMFARMARRGTILSMRICTPITVALLWSKPKSIKTAIKPFRSDSEGLFLLPLCLYTLRLACAYTASYGRLRGFCRVLCLSALRSGHFVAPHALSR